MVTLTKYGAIYNRLILRLEGLSTDLPKPTGYFHEYDDNGVEVAIIAIQNGSIFTEIDTGDTYMYDADNATWYKVTIGGGGGTPQGGIILVGETTTALADNDTTNPIMVDGQSYTAQPNDAVIYGSKEFLFDGTKWHEFGDLSGLSSKDIGAMTNYAKAQTGSAIATSDTLNVAIGKLEKRTDLNETNISNLGTSLSSTSSDEGKVLTADGQGGYSWQASQSGGGKKYLYQCDVMFDAGSQVNRLRFNAQFISSNPDLVINGNISYSDLFSDYLKLSGTSGYAFITNIANVTLSVNGVNNPFQPSSFHRINLEDGHWFLWLSNGVVEISIANNTTVQIKGTKTEI